MAKTKIQPVSKTKTIDYSNEIINNFWLKKNIQSNYQNYNDNLQKIISVFKDVQDAVICIQTEQIDHPEIVKAIFNATQKRNRIYILTNEKDEQLKQLTGSCLIHYGIKNIGSFVLIAPNTDNSKGIIYTAPMLETSLAYADNITLDLDDEQIKILFRFFSDNFWNKAEFEIIENYDNPQKTGEPPLDFLSNIKDFCDADFVIEGIKKINKAALISVPNLQTNEILNLTELKNSAILTSLNNNDLIKKIAENKNSIKSVKQNTNRIIISDNWNYSWLIPKTNISNQDNFYALKLNSKQIEFLDDLINDRIDNAEFEFHLSKSRAELENKTIILLDEIEKEVVIKSESEKNLGKFELEELLPKEEFEKQEPEFEGDKVSVKINYSWKIIPFYTPQNAKKTKLYEEWEKYKNEYKSFINQIEITINESESKNIGEKLKRWFLGKKQTILKYKQELEKVKDVELSFLELSKRKAIIKRVNELAKDVSANLSEINTEIKKTEIEEEIEQFRQEKQKKEDEFEKWKAEQERILKEKEEKKEKQLQEFFEKHNIKKESLATFRNDLERKAGKKNRKNNPKEAEKAQKILDELKEIQGFDFSKKYEDEKRKFEKEIKNLETKLSSKEKELTKIEKEQDEGEDTSLTNVIHVKGNNNKKKTKSNNEFHISDTVEYLPKVGELFELGNQKYLEIEFWEDYELGLKEAGRLKAKLSVKPN